MNIRLIFAVFFFWGGGQVGALSSLDLTVFQTYMETWEILNMKNA